MIDKIKRFAFKNKVAYFFVYIGYLVYGQICAILFFLMKIFPIDHQKIIFIASKGKRYGDNPMYISDELLKRNHNYKLVWLLDKEVNENIPNGIKRFNYHLIRNIYELSTAKVWVDCNMKDIGLLKRKGQLYVQTWHGSYGIKKIAGDLGKNLPLIDKSYYRCNAKKIDLIISNSKKMTEIYRRAFWYDGKFLEYGSPRNDIFFRKTEDIRLKVDEYFQIKGKKIILYAPTFRKGYGTDAFKLNYESLTLALSHKFGGEWVVLVRLHPNNLAEAEGFMNYTDRIINATNYSIMQELLVAADILVTDYSSCMFDFVTTGKTCFLYATDVEKYREERDYYFELEELPFPLAENNEQMAKNIEEFDQDKYQYELEQLFQRVGLHETGHASEKVADYIEKWMEEN